MELSIDRGGVLVNGFGLKVDIEEERVYPLLKSSDVHHGRLDSGKKVIVTQKHLTDDPDEIRAESPGLWQYLKHYEDQFLARKSSIYIGRPQFSMFGVGPYTVSEFKVAVSGLHKQPRFRLIPPMNRRPVIFDDTTYLLPCATARQASLITAAMNGTRAQEFIRATTFADAKRPITKAILQRLDFGALLVIEDREDLLQRADAELERIGSAAEANWPLDLREVLLDEGTSSQSSPTPVQLSLTQPGRSAPA